MFRFIISIHGPKSRSNASTSKTTNIHFKNQFFFISVFTFLVFFLIRIDDNIDKIIKISALAVKSLILHYLTYIFDPQINLILGHKNYET